MGRFRANNSTLIGLLVGLSSFTILSGQRTGATSEDSLLVPETFSGLELRNIGPAQKSGRISDIAKGLPTVDLGRIGIAISPQRPDVIYATVPAA
ncbi:MAG TPA: hypothetical protein VMY18_09525 [Acidobacteriota bacterium]|nr:hypothetical protein [Acidobacteriota bacterium]